MPTDTSGFHSTPATAASRLIRSLAARCREIGATAASPHRPPTNGGIVPTDPITGGKPAQTSTNGGTLPPNDPVGNTRPTVNGSGTVTVSNGVTTYEIPNGPGGVALYSGKDGTITVTNGTEMKTLNGGSVTLSGNVKGVGAAPEYPSGRP